jgi:hypothetical protein
VVRRRQGEQRDERHPLQRAAHGAALHVRLCRGQALPGLQGAEEPGRARQLPRPRGVVHRRRERLPRRRESFFSSFWFVFFVAVCVWRPHCTSLPHTLANQRSQTHNKHQQPTPQLPPNPQNTNKHTPKKPNQPTKRSSTRSASAARAPTSTPT